MGYSFLFGGLTFDFGFVEICGFSNDKSVRSGYRGYVTRPIKKARDIIRNFEETDKFRLEGVRASLKEKSDVFKELDVKILATLDERCS